MNVIDESAQEPSPQIRPAHEVAAELGVASAGGQTPASSSSVVHDVSTPDVGERVEISISTSPVRPTPETRPPKADTPDETEGPGGIRLLLGDARVAGMVLNEARYRALERLLGVPRDQANAATAVAGLMLAEVVYEKGKRFARGPALPSAGDSMLGLGVVREGVYGFVGPSARDLPFAGALLTVAVATIAARPGVRAAVRGMRGQSERLSVVFHHRYGYVVRHGRRYARRVRAAAERLSDGAAEDGGAPDATRGQQFPAEGPRRNPADRAVSPP